MSLLLAALAAFPSSAAHLLPAPLPLPASGAEDSLAFAVRDGTKLTKRFGVVHDLTVQKIQFGDADIDSTSQQQLDISSTIDLEVVDTYRKVKDGRPLELQRVYKANPFHIDISFADARGTKVPEGWDAETFLKHKSVVFTWIPEEKGYSKHYDDVEGLEEHLANLAEDLDLRFLLPKSAAREGAEWAIELRALQDLFAPGGTVPLTWVKGGKGGFSTAIAAGVGGPLHPAFTGDVKGSCRAKWVKSQDSEGGRLAVIELALEVETDADRTEIVRRILRQDEDEAQSPVRHAGVQWKFKGEGTLLWNLAAGRYEKLDVVGRQDVTSDIQFAHGAETSRQLLSMAGALKLTAIVVPPKK